MKLLQIPSPRVAVEDPTPKQQGKVVIAHISDLHFSDSTDPNNWVWKALRQDLQDLNKREPPADVDVLVVTGDVVDSSFEQRFSWRSAERSKSSLSKVKKFLVDDLCAASRIVPESALLVVPGNHDYRWGGMAWSDALFDNFYREFGDYFATRFFRQLGLCFFVFDSNARDEKMELTVNLATGFVKEGDLSDHAHNVAELAKNDPALWNSSTRIALLHHHPMPIGPTEHRDKKLPVGAAEFMLLKNAGLFMQEMVKSKIDLVLHGHRHYPAYSRASFPTPAGVEHPIAVLSAGSVGKKDDYDYCYNLLTICDTGEIALERRVLKLATYEAEPIIPIRSYEVGRNTRFSRLAEGRAKIRAKKYIKFEDIKAGSGDSVMEESFLEARAFAGPVEELERVMSSMSGIFEAPRYRCPPGQQIEWKWVPNPPPPGPEANGKTIFKPPLDQSPVDFFRDGTTFNAICFNQRDRLDSTDQKETEEHVELQNRQAFDEMLLLVRFPRNCFPNDLKILSFDVQDKPDNAERRFAQSCLARLPLSSCALLRIEKPLPGYTYRMTWSLPKDEVDELSLSGSDAGVAAEIINRLLDLRKESNPLRQAVDSCLARLEQDIISAPAYQSKTGDNRLEIAVFAYDPDKHGLVAAATRGSVGQELHNKVIKPGRTIAGQAARRREEVLHVQVGGLRSEAAHYYETWPEDKGLGNHTVIFCIPLFYPVSGGRRVAVLSLGSRSNTSGLLELDKGDRATLALIEHVILWYGNCLVPALGLSALNLSKSASGESKQ